MRTLFLFEGRSPSPAASPETRTAIGPRLEHLA